MRARAAGLTALLLAVIACGEAEHPTAPEETVRRAAVEQTASRAAELLTEAYARVGRGEMAEAWDAWREARAAIGETPEVAEAARSFRAVESRRRVEGEYSALVELARTEGSAKGEEDRLKILARAGAAARTFLDENPDHDNRAEVEAIIGYAERELGLARSYAEALQRARAAEGGGRYEEMAAAAKEALAVFHRKEAKAILDRALAARTPEGMVFIRGGSFLAGPDRTPAHLEAFYIDRHEVTNEEYARFCAETGRKPPERFEDGKPLPGLEKNPVTYVTLDDALAYAKWAGKRLPTCREWERAARGTDGRDYPWGDEWDPAKGHFGSGGTRPVGTTPLDRSPDGVLDMAGNVMEMTLSPEDPEGKTMGPVMKGGHWSDDFHPEYALTFAVYEAERDHLDSGSGFRCAK